MSDDRPLLVIDEGTTSTRAMLFAPDGRVRAVEQRAIRQSYPQPGWVEQDGEEIWQATLACARAVVAAAGGPARVAAIGITNQRETVLFWDRVTGAPLAPAIVWQDRRTADACAALRDAGEEPRVQATTGLLLDPYFSASKMRWALEHWPQLRAAGGRLAMGTVESYLVHRLTGGAHVSDVSNASRTMLMALDGRDWDAGLLALFGVERGWLPDIVGSTPADLATDPALFGGPIPITGIAGDQQAALIGQGCLEPGQVKATFGTGAFILAATGTQRPRSANRLLATVAHEVAGERHYALEGSLFVAGSLIQWLRDGLGLLEDSAESEALARSVTDSAGVVVVPALAGLGAPHWDAAARGSIQGLSFAATRAHIARAALEAMAHQVHDLMTAFAADGAPWAELRVDGGMIANEWLAQDLADMLALEVDRPAMVETTALGAAMLAGVGSGRFATLAQAADAMRGASVRFRPTMSAEVRAARLVAWRDALQRTLRSSER